MLKRLLFYLWAVSLFISSVAQEGESQKFGKVIGQWRSYYMGTVNKGDLKDFNALATGGKFGYSYSRRSWTLRAVGYLSINTGIQDLTQPDEATGKVSRYEAGLFDVNDLTRHVVAFPGELSVGITKNGHQFTFGRLKLISPLLNPQDGRMIPTLEQGFLYHYTSTTKLKAQLGIFNEVASRSTDRFEHVGETFGLYPVGRNRDGGKSGYKGNISSDYIVVMNLAKAWESGWQVNVWNYYVDNVFNTTYSKVTRNPKESKVVIGVEWVNQQRVNNGGNRYDSLTYFADQSSNILGGELGINLGSRQLKIGYDHIFAGGRFLFPREWGREGIFTFQKRERSEGSASNDGLLLTYTKAGRISEGRYKAITSIGYQWKPSVMDPADNKYAQPSYLHINLDLFWIPRKWSGLKPELLLTYKTGTGTYPSGNANFTLNKVDMYQANFIVNYNF